MIRKLPVITYIICSENSPNCANLCCSLYGQIEMFKLSLKQLNDFTVYSKICRMCSEKQHWKSKYTTKPIRAPGPINLYHILYRCSFLPFFFVSNVKLYFRCRTILMLILILIIWFKTHSRHSNIQEFFELNVYVWLPGCILNLIGNRWIGFRRIFAMLLSNDWTV